MRGHAERLTLGSRRVASCPGAGPLAGVHRTPLLRNCQRIGESGGRRHIRTCVRCGHDDGGPERRPCIWLEHNLRLEPADAGTSLLDRSAALPVRQRRRTRGHLQRPVRTRSERRTDPQLLPHRQLDGVPRLESRPCGDRSNESGQRSVRGVALQRRALVSGPHLSRPSGVQGQHDPLGRQAGLLADRPGKPELAGPLPLRWGQLRVGAAPAAGSHLAARRGPGSNPRRLEPGGITSGACLAWNNCWFFGTYGTVVHWDGKTLSDATPPSSQGWLQTEYTDAVARQGTAGQALGLAVGATSERAAALGPLPSQPGGSPPPQLFAWNGSVFSPLSLAVPSIPQPGDPYRTDLVAVDLDAEAQGWGGR